MTLGEMGGGNSIGLRARLYPASVGAADAVDDGNYCSPSFEDSIHEHPDPTFVGGADAGDVCLRLSDRGREKQNPGDGIVQQNDDDEDYGSRSDVGGGSHRKARVYCCRRVILVVRRDQRRGTGCSPIVVGDRRRTSWILDNGLVNEDFLAC